MPSNPDRNLEGISIGKVARQARERNRAERRRDTRQQQREKRTYLDPLSLAQFPTLMPWTSPEHYHLVYQYEDRAVVHWARKYLSQRDAYIEVKRMGDESEPNTEWGDDGRVMIETHLHGRTGLFRVILRVAACVNTGCGRVESPIILPRSAYSVVQ